MNGNWRVSTDGTAEERVVVKVFHDASVSLRLCFLLVSIERSDFAGSS